MWVPTPSQSCEATVPTAHTSLTLSLMYLPIKQALPSSFPWAPAALADHDSTRIKASGIKGNPRWNDHSCLILCAGHWPIKAGRLYWRIPWLETRMSIQGFTRHIWIFYVTAVFAFSLLTDLCLFPWLVNNPLMIPGAVRGGVLDKHCCCEKLFKSTRHEMHVWRKMTTSHCSELIGLHYTCKVFFSNRHQYLYLK